MRGLIALLAIGIPGAVSAADCPLSHAVYEQYTGYELAFAPVDYERHPLNASAAFAMILPGSAEHLDGVVTHPNGIDLPDGIVGYACPLDPTEDQAAACTIWTGVVYALDDSGIVTLPHEDEPAPRQVLLPGFIRNLWYSQQFHELQLVALADDVFTFKACAGR